MSRTKSNSCRLIILALFSLIYFTGFSQSDDFFDTDSSIDFENDCVRGLPEPVINKTKYPDSEFKIENSVGFEKVALSDSETLILKNTGCESYVHVLRFEIPFGERRIDDVTYWYKRLVKQLSIVDEYIDSPINIESAKKRLINYIDNYDNHPLKLGQFITINESEIPTMMSFDNIRELVDNRIALELTIWIGPL